ncbi:putative Copper resistance protein CopC [Streptantibioticus cattleyicolor NRRL 8057 = DSM 46488]|nr:putative Copper resistance protein CopC [Streptantibioticus cattleyicolor NRRL 8057 = DSM 46488]
MRPRGVAARLRRRVAALAAGVVAVLGLVLAAAPAASAHASLLFTTPTVGSSVPTSPKALTLIFDQPVALSGPTVRLAGPSGAAAGVGAVTRGQGGSVLTAPVRGTLAPGVYTVTWQVVAQDGDVITNSYRFAVGPAAAGALSAGGTGSAATAGRGATTVLRWVLFAALALVLGEAAAVWRVRGHRPQGAPLPRRWALPGVGAGLLAALGLVALIVGNGSLLAAVSHPDLGQARSRPGVLALVEADAFAVAAGVGLRWRRRAWLPLPVVVVVEGLRAHPQAFAPGWGVMATVVHVTAAAVWAGALVYVLRCALAWRGTPGAAREAVDGYARLAAWLFATVVATGTLNAVAVVPLSKVVSTGYGRLLLVKLAVVALAAGCALAARLRLRDGRVGVRPMRAEAVLLAGVLAVTAALTAAAPPRQAGGALPAAPPVSGPVVPLGARAGLIGVSVTASAGQVVVQLTAPGADAPGADAGYRLSATLADPSGRQRTLALRGCGTGCFVSPVTWRMGASHLTLRAASRHWAGGAASVSVPWPAHADPQALVRLARQLRQSGAFTLYERVTSDTAQGPGIPHSIPTTGARFLAGEPFSGGRAAAVDSVRNPDGTTTLLLGFPADRVQIELILDSTGRPVRESLTDANHLTTRTFIYPEKGEG